MTDPISCKRTVVTKKQKYKPQPSDEAIAAGAMKLLHQSWSDACKARDHVGSNDH